MAINSVPDPEKTPEQAKTPKQTSPQTGTLLGKVRAALSEIFGSQQDANGSDSAKISRRSFLRGAVGTAGAVALAGTFGADTMVAETLPEDQQEELAKKVAEDLEKIDKNPDLILEFLKSREATHWLLFLNFVDFIGGLIGTEKNGKVKKGMALSGIARGGSTIMGKILKQKDTKIAKILNKIQTFDDKFPHANLYLATTVTTLLAAGAQKLWMPAEDAQLIQAEAQHGAIETGIGVGMLTALTSVSDGINLRTEGLIEQKRAEDEMTVAHAKRQAELFNSPGEKKSIQEINHDIGIYTQAMATVAGPAPIAAALRQFPFFAFGNADVTKEILERSLPLTEEIFKLFKNYTVAEIKQLIGKRSIKNEAIVRVFERFLEGKGDDVMLQNGVIKELADDYFKDVGYGLMSSTMDVSQGMADVAPAIVGSVQSFGTWEMVKTASVNFFYSFVAGFIETKNLAERMGVNYSDLWNESNRKKMLRFWGRSLKNFAKYLFALGNYDKHGAEFNLVKGLFDSLGKILGTLTQGATHIHPAVAELFGTSLEGVDANLFKEALKELKDFMGDIEKEIAAEQKEEEAKKGETVYRGKVGGELVPEERKEEIRRSILLRRVGVEVGTRTDHPEKNTEIQKRMLEILNELNIESVSDQEINAAFEAGGNEAILAALIDKIDGIFAAIELKVIADPELVELIRQRFWDEKIESNIEEMVLSATRTWLAPATVQRKIRDFIQKRLRLDAVRKLEEVLQETEMPGVEPISKAHELHKKIEVIALEVKGKLETKEPGIDLNGGTDLEKIHRTLEHIAERIASEPEMLDLIRMNYWEQKVGDTIAETIFVVTGQGLSLESVKMVVNKYFYQNMLKFADYAAAEAKAKLGIDLKQDFSIPGLPQFTRNPHEMAIVGGSSTVHSGISMVADNWADQILHALQLSTEVYIPGILEKFNLPISLTDTPKKKMAFGKLNSYQKYQLMFREVSKSNLLSPEQFNQFRDMVHDKFLITKYVSVLIAIFGGGESTIGNSPHFRAFLGEVKNLLSLGGSFKDLVRFTRQHLGRFGMTYVAAMIINPIIEGLIFENPFTPENDNNAMFEEYDRAKAEDAAVQAA